jgi:hypothetical protein
LAGTQPFLKPVSTLKSLTGLSVAVTDPGALGDRLFASEFILGCEADLVDGLLLDANLAVAVFLNEVFECVALATDMAATLADHGRRIDNRRRIASRLTETDRHALGADGSIILDDLETRNAKEVPTKRIVMRREIASDNAAAIEPADHTCLGLTHCFGEGLGGLSINL